MDDIRQFRSLLQAAWDRRARLRERVDAFRWLNGAASGAPGTVVDYYAGYLVVYAYERDWEGGHPGYADAMAGVSGALGAVLKDRAAPDELGRGGSRELFGSAPETVAVREGPLRFHAHLRHPRNVGLFLDTRPLREALREGGRDRDVLNLFSHTCSLGAAAAAGGARVVNVDVSSKYLRLGRENFRLNGLAGAGGRFVRMDAEAYLDWAERKSLGFDAVILDPPSFARWDGGTFVFERDYWRLAGKCARRLRPGGTLHALANYGGIAPERFRDRLEQALREQGRPPGAIVSRPPPEDFDPPPEGSAPPRPAVREGSLVMLEAALP